MSNNKLKAYIAACLDIKEELDKQHRSFFMFIKKLNPIMDKLVEKQLKEQENICKTLIFPKYDNNRRKRETPREASSV